jgi:hypothetical protein
MRAALGAAAGAALMATGLAMSACAGGGSAGGPATSASSSPDQVMVAAYSKTTEARTARTSMSTQVSMGGQSLPITASGVVDFAAHTAQLTETLPGNAGTSETRFVNGVVYLQLPGQLGAQLAGGKPWVSIDVNKITQQQYGSSLSELEGSMPSDPADVLGYLRVASDQVREIGPDTVDGTPTKHYDVTIDLDKAAAGRPAQVQQATQKLEQQLGTHTLPAQVWIDDQGRLRKITLEEKVTPPSTASGATATGPVSLSLTETLSDFGTPVNVTAPPADQTADITDKLTAGGR